MDKFIVPRLAYPPRNTESSLEPQIDCISLAAYDTANGDTAPKPITTAGRSVYVNNMWYFAMPSKRLKAGKMTTKLMLGQPILIGRDKNGKVFAMKDICPHQAVPLSKGSFDGCEVECCFHGWKFDTAGLCTEIPSLVEGQNLKPCMIATESYPCREVQGNIWIFFGPKKNNLPSVPTAPGLDELLFDQTTTTLVVPTHVDYAALALIDTAHVPFVHKSWWWRSKRSMKEKSKLYVPADTGWTMVKHSPSKHSPIFKLIGDHIETEISFRLPGCRREYIEFRGKTILSGITALTPIDENTTELNHTTYWTMPYVKPFVEPIVQYFVRTFLGQDRDIAFMQAEVLKYKPQLVMTIKDAGTPGAWYFQLKRAWNEATANNVPFENPVKEKILRWKT